MNKECGMQKAKSKHNYLYHSSSSWIILHDMLLFVKSYIFLLIINSLTAFLLPSRTWAMEISRLKEKETSNFGKHYSTSTHDSVNLEKYKQINSLFAESDDTVEQEKCILVAVDKSSHDVGGESLTFSLRESLDEMRELVGTAKMVIKGLVIQRMSKPHARTYLGTGKIHDLIDEIRRTQATTIVVDDDLTPQQQRSLEDNISEKGIHNAKILDRTAVILEIFAQRAKSREGQLQVELAMLEYRMTRGPRARGEGYDSGCGFRGPGETKIETDKRIIKEKILTVKKELQAVQVQRELQRKGRIKLNLPIVTLVGYTNAGKSTLMNRLSHADVLAENMLFATLDPTTRKVRLARTSNTSENSNNHAKGQEVFLSDTVGFISKLPTNLIAAFRATLEEVVNADVLVLVCDRSSPVWEKQRNTVLRELKALNCSHIPIVELWNKIDLLPNASSIRQQALTMPIDVESALEIPSSKLLLSNANERLFDPSDNNDPDNDETEYLSQSFDDYMKKKEPSPQKSREFMRKYFTVAASAKTGLGMEDFLNTLEHALSQFLVSVTIIVPYKEAGYIIDLVYRQGVVESIEHLEQGTKIYARVPKPLILSSLKPYVEKS